MLKLIALLNSVIAKAQKDHITAFSAQAAFFTVLSFFPFLIVVLSLMRFVPVTPKDLIGLVNYYLPEQYSVSLVAVINSLYGKSRQPTCHSRSSPCCGPHQKESFP